MTPEQPSTLTPTLQDSEPQGELLVHSGFLSLRTGAADADRSGQSTGVQDVLNACNSYPKDQTSGKIDHRVSKPPGWVRGPFQAREASCMLGVGL